MTRSTFSAELHGLADSFELSKLIAYAITEITRPVHRISDLIHMEECGQLALPIECIVDARGVYDCLAKTDIKPPSESSLVLVLKQLKQDMWVDTRDMIADELNRGIIARSALFSAASKGYWKLNYECRRHQELLRTPVLDPLRDEPAVQARLTNARLRGGKQI